MKARRRILAAVSSMLCLLASVAAPACAARSAARPELSAKERADGWRLLFDGRTTAGWRGYRQQTMPDGWKVEDGALSRVAEGGDIVTLDAFDDFELMLEWKVVEAGNSGIFYRATETDDIIWHNAPEMQVLDNARHADGKSPLTSAGALYAVYPPAKDVSCPAGEWNEAHLIVRGNHVEHWLNGQKIVECEIGSADWDARVKASKFNVYPEFGRARKGFIGLQDHGDQVWYRNIKVRALTPSVTNE